MLAQRRRHETTSTSTRYTRGAGTVPRATRVFGVLSFGTSVSVSIVFLCRLVGVSPGVFVVSLSLFLYYTIHIHICSIIVYMFIWFMARSCYLLRHSEYGFLEI